MSDAQHHRTDLMNQRVFRFRFPVIDLQSLKIMVIPLKVYQKYAIPLFAQNQNTCKITISHPNIVIILDKKFSYKYIGTTNKYETNNC